jgi:DegV family protein with EDD domain
MSSICILTDSSAQFPQLAFSGRNLVRIIPFDVELNGILYEEGKDLKTSNLPATANQSLNPHLRPPAQEKLRQLFVSLGQSYNEIIAILVSSQLSNLYTCAEEAVNDVNGRVSVQLIDSQSTSVGLGLLVQTAAEAAAKGISAFEIERTVRSLIPHIYAVFCTPGLSYLYHAGYIDQAQAAIGEMLGLLPIFALEEGKLTPLEKVRTHRNALDFFQEFLDEFDTLHHIALLQSVQPNQQDSRLLREHAEDYFHQIPFSEHTINLPLATLLGPRTMGLIVVENPNEKSSRGESFGS